MATATAPRRTMLGNMAVQSAGSSTVFTSTAWASQASNTCRFTVRSPVAAMTSHRPGHVFVAERALKHPYAAPRRQFPHRGVELGRHHHHIRAGFDERHDLARGDGAGANDQARFAGELEEQWQRWLRRARCGRRVSVCAGHGPSSLAPSRGIAALPLVNLGEQRVKRGGT